MSKKYNGYKRDEEDVMDFLHNTLDIIMMVALVALMLFGNNSKCVEKQEYSAEFRNVVNDK